MRQGQMFSFLLGLGLLLPMATAAEEAPANPLLVAHLHALHRGMWALSPPREAHPVTILEEVPVAPTLGSTLWSRQKGAAAAAASLTASIETAPTPRFSFTLQDGKPRLSLVAPLPRNLPPTMFTHGRVRGPFEQVHPRRW